VHLDVAVCLPQEAETVGLIRSAARNMLDLFGVADDCIEDVLLALSEACTNVIEHASTDDEYEVNLRVDDQQCEVSVRNAGSGFDASDLAGVMPDPSSARGRGVAIMRAVTDGVHFSSDPQGGTIVRLVRRLSVRDDGALRRLRRPESA
jgi:serine/threonine-protein kinase RsbW